MKTLLLAIATLSAFFVASPKAEARDRDRDHHRGSSYSHSRSYYSGGRYYYAPRPRVYYSSRPRYYARPAPVYYDDYRYRRTHHRPVFGFLFGL